MILPNPIDGSRVEFVDPRRWALGPLEFVFVEDDGRPAVTAEAVEIEQYLAKWNRLFRAGAGRAAGRPDLVLRFVTFMRLMKNPNLVLVPCANGYTELHTMLASLCTDEALRSENIGRAAANFCMTPFTVQAGWAERKRYARAAEKAFANTIWSRIAKRGNGSPAKRAFSNKSSIVKLTEDWRLWAAAAYKVALNRCERLPQADEPDDGSWLGPAGKLLRGGWDTVTRSDGSLCHVYSPPPPPQPLLLTTTFEVDGKDYRGVASVETRRPLVGGQLWDPDDPQSREEVLAELFKDDGPMRQLDAVAAVLLDGHCLEDFSNSASWIKQDAERRFFRKSGRGPRFEVHDCVSQEAVFHDPEATVEDGRVLRDVFAVLDPEQQRIAIFLMWGKTQNQIANAMNTTRGVIANRLRSIRRTLRRYGIVPSTAEGVE